MHRTLRQAEGFAVPVECLKILYRAKPITCAVVVRYRYFAPANFLHRIARYRAAQRLGDKLPAEAMPQHGNIRGYRIADQCQHRRYPRQIIVDAHRPAHEHQPGVGLRRARHGISRINGDQPPRDLLRIEEFGEIAGAFSGGRAEDGDGFHKFWEGIREKGSRLRRSRKNATPAFTLLPSLFSLLIILSFYSAQSAHKPNGCVSTRSSPIPQYKHRCAHRHSAPPRHRAPYPRQTWDCRRRAP